MAYRISILSAAVRQLAELPRPDQKRLKDKIDRLADDPRPAGAKVLRGKREYLRIRSGNYRIVYTIDDTQRTVLVIMIGHRRNVYRRL